MQGEVDEKLDCIFPQASASRAAWHKLGMTAEGGHVGGNEEERKRSNFSKFMFFPSKLVKKQQNVSSPVPFSLPVMSSRVR